MRRARAAAVVAAVVAAATTLGGAGVLSASSAEESAQWRTTRFISKTLAEQQFGQRFVGADEVIKRGEVIGYNSLTGRFLPKRNRIVVRVGVALRGGVIMGRVSADAPQDEGDAIVFRGPILGGSGRFDGIRGRIVARIPAGDTEGRAHVTLRWTT